MNNTFINPVLTKASELGVGLYEDTSPFELLPHASQAEIELVIRAIYRQILGNAHIMESERLNITESRLSNGDITVREFIRKLAKSELYRSLFFDNCTSFKAIELNFKHLLGRAPHSYSEVIQHSQILHENGYEAEIDSYLDSQEYQEIFGENIVPYYQGYKTQTGKNIIGFTYLFNLLRGSCSSDRSNFLNSRVRLQKTLISKHPSNIIPLSTVPDNWQRTDINKMLSKVLNLKSHRSLMPSNQRQPETPYIEPRSVTWKNQYNAFEDSNPLELTPGCSEVEKEIVINATYKQVLGNAHIMESERLRVAESQLKQGQISVREFVRIIAKSELYRSRFVNNCPRYRTHELNFKHLLGRAPDGYQETLYHSQVLDSQGYEADIDSYIDSDEYQDTFGENIVPYYRGYTTQTGKRLMGYTNMFKMLESYSTSDKAGKSANSPRLIAPIIYNNPDGNVPVTDINKLLQEVLRPKPQTRPTSPQFTPVIPQQQESEQLEQEIAELEAQLARLQSLSSIGSAGINRWQNYYIDVTSINESTSSYSSSLSWNQTDSSQGKKEHIAALKQQIAQASSLAALGEARLNKWRSRTFY